MLHPRHVNHKWLVPALILCVLLSGAPVYPAEGEPSPAIVAEPWPAADQMFRKDDRWLGGDGGSSIDLGDGRVLWLFGDSFIAASNRHLRSESVFIRNSVAIQSGYDPLSAGIRFYWKVKNNTPQSFFPGKGTLWFWPGQGVVTNGFLLIFLLEIEPSDNDLGFDFAGWKAVRIFNYKDEPEEWNLCWTEIAKNPQRMITGSGGLVMADDYLYAFSSDESKTHDVYLARWPIKEVARGDLRNPRWWIGRPGGWCGQDKLRDKPAKVFTKGQTEFTVNYEPHLGGFVQIQSTGFGSADIAFRTARRLVGPWSPLRRLYRPKEYGTRDIFIYAGKAHPEQSGSDMIITYVVSHLDSYRVLNDRSLYYPRFLKCRIIGNIVR